MDGLGIEAISLGDVAGARAAISTGTAGGKDDLVGEIWKTIPFSLMILIWFFFRLRSEFGCGEVSDAWRTWCLIGIPKIHLPKSFNNFRYICNSPVLQKW